MLFQNGAQDFISTEADKIKDFQILVKRKRKIFLVRRGALRKKKSAVFMLKLVENK